MEIEKKILDEIITKNLKKDLELLSSSGYNEVEVNYRVMKNENSPKNIFVISTILKYNGNSWIGSSYGVYPFSLNGNFDGTFDIDSVCKGLWFSKLQ